MATTLKKNGLRTVFEPKEKKNPRDLLRDRSQELARGTSEETVAAAFRVIPQFGEVVNKLREREEQHAKIMEERRDMKNQREMGLDELMRKEYLQNAIDKAREEKLKMEAFGLSPEEQQAALQNQRAEFLSRVASGNLRPDELVSAQKFIQNNSMLDMMSGKSGIPKYERKLQTVLGKMNTWELQRLTPSDLYEMISVGSSWGDSDWDSDWEYEKPLPAWRRFPALAPPMSEMIPDPVIGAGVGAGVGAGAGAGAAAGAGAGAAAMAVDRKKAIKDEARRRVRTRAVPDDAAVLDFLEPTPDPAQAGDGADLGPIPPPTPVDGTRPAPAEELDLAFDGPVVPGRAIALEPMGMTLVDPANINNGFYIMDKSGNLAIIRKSGAVIQGYGDFPELKKLAKQHTDHIKKINEDREERGQRKKDRTVRDLFEFAKNSGYTVM